MTTMTSLPPLVNYIPRYPSTIIALFCIILPIHQANNLPPSLSYEENQSYHVASPA